MIESGAPGWAIALAYAGGALFWLRVLGWMDERRERKRQESDPPMRDVTPK